MRGAAYLILEILELLKLSKLMHAAVSFLINSIYDRIHQVTLDVHSCLPINATKDQTYRLGSELRVTRIVNELANWEQGEQGHILYKDKDYHGEGEVWNVAPLCDVVITRLDDKLRQILKQELCDYLHSKAVLQSY